MNEKHACKKYLLKCIRDEKQLAEYVTWYIGSHIKNSETKNDGEDAAKEAAIQEFIAFFSVAKMLNIALSDMIQARTDKGIDDYVRQVLKDTEIQTYKTCHAYRTAPFNEIETDPQTGRQRTVQRPKIECGSCCRYCAFGGEGQNKNLEAEIAVLKYICKRRQNLDDFISCGGNADFFRSVYDIGDDGGFIQPLIYPIYRKIYEFIESHVDRFYSTPNCLKKGGIMCKIMEDATTTVEDTRMQHDIDLYKTMYAGAYGSVLNTIQSADDLDSVDMQLKVTERIAYEQKLKKRKNKKAEANADKRANEDPSPAPEAPAEAQKEGFFRDNEPSGAVNEAPPEAEKAQDGVLTDLVDSNTAETPSVAQKQGPDTSPAPETAPKEDTKATLPPADSSTNSSEDPLQAYKGNEIRDISSSRTAFSEEKGSKHEDLRNIQQVTEENSITEETVASEQPGIYPPVNNDEYSDLANNSEIKYSYPEIEKPLNEKENTSVPDTQGLIIDTENHATLPSPAPFYSSEDDILLAVLSQKTLKKLVPFKQCKARVFAHTADIGVLPIEIIRDENGTFYYLIWASKGGYFSYVTVSEMPAEIILLLKKKSIVKVCWQPYYLYSVSRMHGVNVSTVHSIYTTDLALNPNAYPCAYSDLVRYYAAVLRGVAVPRKTDDGEMADLYNAMPYYEEVFHVQQRENRLSKEAYTALSCLDAALGFSYMLSINFETERKAFKIRRNGEMRFFPFEEMDAKRQGYLMTYAINAEDIPDHNALDLYKEALIFLEKTGRFRKINIQILYMDRQVLHIFVANKYLEYMTTLLQNFFNKWAVKNKVERFALIANHKAVIGKDRSHLRLPSGKIIDNALSHKMSVLIGKRRFIDNDTHRAKGILELRKKAKQSKEKIVPFGKS